ncbi:MAG TPA: class I SAM-dependent methyltransferase, partial [Kiritimatiellae bacterium]|nr:class I SAM-dependent methyltransferase [Kiritimatiellia bacterium]
MLEEMYRTGCVRLPDGSRRPASSGISARHAAALYHMVLREEPELVVETGMGQGFSTLAILCALSRTGGRLISIDPYEGWESGMKAALFAVERAGYAGRHRHIRRRSSEALPALLAEGTRIQMGYVDGSHRFEDVFIDFYYLDRMLVPGGVIGFDNCGWADVYRVIRFLQRRSGYREVDAGLVPDYRARNPLRGVLRRILGRPRQDRYFRKPVAGGGR